MSDCWWDSVAHHVPGDPGTLHLLLHPLSMFMLIISWSLLLLTSPPRDRGRRGRRKNPSSRNFVFSLGKLSSFWRLFLTSHYPKIRPDAILQATKGQAKQDYSDWFWLIMICILGLGREQNQWVLLSSSRNWTCFCGEEKQAGRGMRMGWQ